MTSEPTPAVVTALSSGKPVFQRKAMVRWVSDGDDMSAFVDQDVVWMADRSVKIDSTRVDLIVPGLGPQQIETPVGWYCVNPGETVTLAWTNRPVASLSRA